MVKVGVLALQGAFAKHIEMLQNLGVEAAEVRKSRDLEACQALIIPGGESTTFLRHLQEGDLLKSLSDFGHEHPVFGTCAGLILMSKEIVDEERRPFGWLDIAVERNAYGRQAESFKSDVEMHLSGRHPTAFPAIFIRAPRICSVGPEVEVLATHKGEPVLVKQGRFLGSTFHPELTDNATIHSYFLKFIK